MFIAAAVFSGLPGSVSPQQLAENIQRQFKKPVVIEWSGEKSLLLLARTSDEGLEAWLSREARGIDRVALITPKYIALRASWLPFTLRQYDLLNGWSVDQKRAEQSDFSNSSGRISFVHSEGCSSSPSELAAAGWLKWKSIDPPYRDYRFVCSAPSTNIPTLAEAIAACFGADTTSSETILRIDPKALRARRRLQAQQHITKLGLLESHESIVSQIEIAALDQMSDKTISSLFKSLRSEEVMTQPSGTTGHMLVLLLWDLVCKLEQKSGREPEKVRDNSPVQIWATGKGTFGGRLERPDGYGIYF